MSKKCTVWKYIMENRTTMDAATARQPQANDEKEIGIRERLVKTVLTTEFSRKTVNLFSKTQQSFFEEAFNDLGGKESTILNSYLETINKLNEYGQTKIISGSENLHDLQGNRGVIIITNHLGMSKLCRIDNKNRSFPVNLDEFEPFLIRHAPLVEIAKKMEFNIHESAVELPQKLSDIQKACQVVVVQASGSNRTEKLIDDCNKIFNSGKQLVVMYPEGGTSGKRNSGGPYDMDEFHTGAFVVAAQTGVPILPVTQYFNPETGYELDIFQPISVKNNDREYLQELIETSRTEMQQVLNRRIKPQG